MGATEGLRRWGRLAMGVALVAAPWVPAVAAASEPDPSGVVVFLVGDGGGKDAALATLGAGLSPWDDGRTRVDLLGRVGFASAELLPLEQSPGLYGNSDVSWDVVIGEVALARRLWRLEPWVSAGGWTAQPHGRFEYYCPSSGVPACGTPSPFLRVASFDGTRVGGATFAGGLRVAFGDHFLIEVEARWRNERRSVFEDFGGLSKKVGGTSGAFALVWRLGARERGARPEPVAAPPPPPEEPSPPLVAPAAGPAAAAATLCGQPLFSVHAARRHRCYPDPVRGGLFCEAGRVDGEFTDRDACERACRLQRDACPAEGALGLACERCVKGCGEPRRVGCAQPNHAAPEAGGCRIEAGAWGNATSVVVPTTCAPAP